VVGHFDNPGGPVSEKIACLLDWTRQSRSPEAIYFLLNPPNPAIAARSLNEFESRAEHRAVDADIIVLRYLLIDFDVVLPAGISASDSEHQAALDAALQVRDFLTQCGWPPLVRCDSGNGGHLIARLDDLANTADNVSLLQKVLQTLDQLFSTGAVHVDLCTFNPARLTKCYGTICRKGTSTTDRPHRLSHLLEAPADYHDNPVTLVQLQEFVEKFFVPPPPPTSRNSTRKQANNRSYTEQQINDALDYIADVDDRDVWLRVGMAVKSYFGEGGRGLWDAWSRKSTKFDAADQGKTWNSIDSGGGVTIATLVKLALDGGWAGARASRAGRRTAARNGKVTALADPPAHEDCPGDEGPATAGRPETTDFIYDKYDPEGMLQELLRRSAYLKEMDNVADLDDFIIRSIDGFGSYAAKYNALKLDPDTGKWRKVNTAQRWRESSDRIELLKPVYEPGLPFPICEIEGQLYFNLWRGFAAEPVKGNVNLMLKVVGHAFQGMPEEKKHFLRFHAHACQHPGEKMMHALMLISRMQGIGKSLLGEIIGYGLWGERNFSEVEHGHLGANFNSYLKHKKFMLANEMLLSSSTASDKRKDANTIKNAITRDRVEINEKYIKQYFTRDVLCWMLTSNFDDAVWLDREDDRRLHISRLKQQVPLAASFGKDFAPTVKAWAKSKDGSAAIHYFFLNYPCGDFAAKASPPITEGQRIVYEMGLTTLEKLVRDIVEDPLLSGGRDLVRVDEIRTAFSKKYPKLSPPPSDQALGSAISRFGGCYITKKLQWTPAGGKKQQEIRVWALRNAEFWQSTTPQYRAAHYLDPGKHPAG
jgi:Primase C terminal 2 (PriCT-2)/Family of unknown function (DUF5906)